MIFHGSIFNHYISLHNVVDVEINKYSPLGKDKFKQHSDRRKVCSQTS